MKKKIVLSVSAIALAGLITGCGGGSSSSKNSTASTSSSTSTTQKSVKVVDAYVIGANVCDEKGLCVSTDENGTATADFANTALTATAGYIDVNNNNIKDDSDIELPATFTLKTPAGKSVISPITDLIANGANPAQLAKVLGVKEADLYSDPIATGNVELAKAIQIVYALKVENKTADLISKVNNYTFSAQTDLPPMDKNVTVEQPKKDTNTTPATTDLPMFKAATTDLPAFDSVTTAAPAKENKTQENAEAKGSLALFANLASSVASAEAKNLITAVVNSTATSPIGLEKEIAEVKKELLTTEETTANTTAEESKPAENVEPNTTTETATETNTTSENSEENTTSTTEENTTSTTEENTTTETPAQTTNTTSSAKTDLPPM